jgi:hypothetical protein
MKKLKYGAIIILLGGVLRSQSVGSADKPPRDFRKEPLKIYTVTNTSDLTSVEVMKLIRQKLGAYEKLLQISADGPSADFVFQADCMSRNSQSDAYACFYTLHYAGTGGKTFMGGGINAAKTADETALALVSSLAQDIVENANNAMRTNAIESLEACLFLTQSSCAVPNLLALELKTKTINLSQYVQRGGLKKK